jgi:hypothetical protein
MSPEQGKALEVDPRCDLRSLATVAYEALTGELPVCGGSTEELLDNLRAGRFVGVHQRDANLPEGLDDFFRRAFAARIEDRFSNATEIARAFERAIGDEATREDGRSTRAASSRMRSALTSCQPTIVGVPRRTVAGKHRVRPAIMAIVGFALVLATGAAAGTVSRMSKSLSSATSGRATAGHLQALGGCAQGFVETPGGRCLAVSSGATDDAGAADRTQAAVPPAPAVSAHPAGDRTLPAVRPTIAPAAAPSHRRFDRSAVL